MKVIRIIVPLLVVVSLVLMGGITTGDVRATDISSILGHSATCMPLVGVNVSDDGKIVYSETESAFAGAAAVTQLKEVLNTNDPYVGKQWALNSIRLDELWQATRGKQAVIVAVLDTGIDHNHEDLQSKVLAEVNFTDSPTPDDIYGHGTHIAGIISAIHNNGLGILGIAPESQLLNVKIADDKGRCNASTVAKGIVWAIDNGASVINISIELGEPSPELEEAINYAWNRGAVVVAAAGNAAADIPVYPAFYQNSLAVAAIDQNNNLAPLSNYGGWIDVAAPGFNIYSTLPDNNYGYKTGTSFAAAYVSGTAALLFNMVNDTNGDGKLNNEVRTAIDTFLPN